MVFEVRESTYDGFRVIGCVLYHLLGLNIADHVSFHKNRVVCPWVVSIMAIYFTHSYAIEFSTLQMLLT